uniref:NADH dehydrogenase subunit 2 n=1 Tax=Sigara lateralis TaxID=537456 RepID=UPI00286C6ED8|nr:NADH dehydrogenase subunit 2 [Sigara lateralis]WKD80500.1 NADH dehydrogenase subunit 2 [Sigara lateralis]
MMKNYSKFLFLITLIMGSMLTLSSNNWFSMWMGLEINLISFIPLITNYKNSSSESAMIYFLVQSIGSILFISSIIMTSMLMYKTFMELMMIISMALKMGMAPTHMWMPEIMEKMSWPNCMILMTWQKLAPLSIMSYMENKMIIILALYSTMIGAIGGLNQTSTRKIMAFSSINHLGWMNSTLWFNNQMWIKYFIMYSMITLIVSMYMWMNSIFFINQFKSNTSMINKINLIIMMMSLGGLPPFLGFLPKWLVIQTLIMNNMYPIMLIMIMSTLLTLFYYLRMMSSIMMMNQYSMKWELKNKKINLMSSMCIIINMMLPTMLIIVLN